jgi:hypothetical protein
VAGSIRNADSRAFLKERAADAGATAAVNRVPYGDNPHAGDPELKLAWSEAHNGMRARLAMDADERGAR